MASCIFCRASNEYESVSDEVSVSVEDPQGEPVEICEDNPSLANCEMIVRANWCFVGQFPEICCKSCKEAGAEPPTTTASPPPTTEELITTEATDETEGEVVENVDAIAEIETTSITETTEDLELDEAPTEAEEQEIDEAVEPTEVSDEAVEPTEASDIAIEPTEESDDV